MKRNRALIAKKISRMQIPTIKLRGLDAFLKPEEMPILDPTPLGRHRLIQSFKRKFGDTFRNVPGVSGVIKEFDRQRDMIKKTIKIGVEE